MPNSMAHVAIAVNNISSAKLLFELLAGSPATDEHVVEKQRVKTSFIKVGNTSIELLEPFGEQTPISKFLDQRGGGIHHICIETRGFDELIRKIKSQGTRTLGDPSIGAKGKRIIFLHPKDTFNVLIELEEE